MRAGGWWGRPAAWKANTAVLGVAMLGAAYLVGLAGEARAVSIASRVFGRMLNLANDCRSAPS